MILRSRLLDVRDRFLDGEEGYEDRIFILQLLNEVVEQSFANLENDEVVLIVTGHPASWNH